MSLSVMESSGHFLPWSQGLEQTQLCHLTVSALRVVRNQRLAERRGKGPGMFTQVSHPAFQMLLIFQALEAILLRTASDLSHLHMVGTSVVKKLLGSHMKLLGESLYASGYR